MYVFDRCDPPRSIQIAASGAIARGPSLIVGVIVAGGGADAAVHVYDGVNAQGERKLSVYSADKSTTPVSIPDGIKCEKGIYVSVNAATDLTTVLFYVGHEPKNGDTGKQGQ